MSDVWEVEQKYIVAQIDQLEKRLEEIGAKESHSETQSDNYLAHPCRDFKSTDEAFRLRSAGDHARVTYKGPRVSGLVKTRPEIELTIDAGETAHWLRMFEALGFRPLPTVKKRRRCFNLLHAGRSFNVGLDQVELLGDFAEIELLVSCQEDLPQAGAAIQSLGSALGLNQVQHKSYLAMLLEKIGRA